MMKSARVGVAEALWVLQFDRFAQAQVERLGAAIKAAGVKVE